jgi:hypothetical protein
MKECVISFKHPLSKIWSDRYLVSQVCNREGMYYQLYSINPDQNPAKFRGK